MKTLDINGSRQLVRNPLWGQGVLCWIEKTYFVCYHKVLENHNDCSKIKARVQNYFAHGITQKYERL